MKKLLICLFVICLSVSIAYADSEISFQNIPWLSDDETVVQGLIEAGYIRKGFEIDNLNTDNNVYIIFDEDANYHTGMDAAYKDVCYSLSLEGSAKGKIAGYPVKNIVLTFAYDGSFQLISTKVELINADYSKLIEKISKVYGEYQNNVTEYGVGSIVWSGENNSSVILYTDSEGYYFDLVYGRLDAVEILQKCLEVDPDDVSGL